MKNEKAIYEFENFYSKLQAREIQYLSNIIIRKLSPDYKRIAKVEKKASKSKELFTKTKAQIESLITNREKKVLLLEGLEDVSNSIIKIEKENRDEEAGVDASQFGSTSLKKQCFGKEENHRSEVLNQRLAQAVIRNDYHRILNRNLLSQRRSISRQSAIRGSRGSIRSKFHDKNIL